MSADLAERIAAREYPSPCEPRKRLEGTIRAELASDPTLRDVRAALASLAPIGSALPDSKPDGHMCGCSLGQLRAVRKALRQLDQLTGAKE